MMLHFLPFKKNNSLEPWISSQEINTCKNMAALESLIIQKITKN